MKCANENAAPKCAAIAADWSLEPSSQSSGAGSRVDIAHLRVGMLRRQLAVHEREQVLHLLREELRRAAAAQRPRGELVAAGRAPDAEVDATGIERLQHAERLGHFQR